MMLVQFIILIVVFFGAVIFAMKKIISTDTQVAVGRLDAVYQDLLAKQKELSEKIEEAEQQYQQKKEEADKIGEKVRAEAIEEMRAKRDELLKQGKSQADEIQARAREQTEELFRKTEIEAKTRVVDICSAILQLALEANQFNEFHNIIFDKFIEKGKEFDLTKVGEHIDTVTVKTPFPLDEQQKAKLNAMISSKLNRILKIEEIFERQLIAGVLLQFGSLLVDGSLANMVREANEKQKEKIRLGQEK